MSRVDRKILASLAFYMLEELAARRGGRVKRKYWKSLRMVEFWLGKDTAKLILDKLSEGGYIKFEDDYVVLLREFKPRRSLNAILREVYNHLQRG